MVSVSVCQAGRGSPCIAGIHLHNFTQKRKEGEKKEKKENKMDIFGTGEGRMGHWQCGERKNLDFAPGGILPVESRETDGHG